MFRYRDNFAGGACELPLSLLGETEVEDCRNVHARGGVLQQCPEWIPLGVSVPQGKAVKAGVSRPDDTTVLVLWDATAGYTVSVVDADGATMNDLGDVPDWTAGDGRVQGIWNPRGTVLISDQPGNWPAVVLPDDGLDTLDSLNVRVRGEDEYQVGIYNGEDRLFQSSGESGEDVNFKNADPPFALSATSWVTIASDVTFNGITIRLTGTTAGVTGNLYVVDEDGEIASRSTATIDAGALVFNEEWDNELGAVSANRYSIGGVEQEGATVGVDGVRMAIELSNAGSAQIDRIEVRHSQYFRQVCSNVSPHLAAYHRNRLVVAFDNIIQFGFVNDITRWEPRQEYFVQGGDRITAMQSHENFLAVFQRGAVYAVTGSSDRSWAVERLADFSGTDSPDGTASDLGFLLYSDTKHRLTMLLRATDVRQIAKHYENKIDQFRGRNGEAAIHPREDDSFLVVYRNGAAQPSDEASEASDRTKDRYVCLLAEPETVRQDPRTAGWRCSLFPVDGPGPDDAVHSPITMSWVTRDRVPVVVAGNVMYRFEGPPRGPRKSWCTLPVYVGGDQSMGDVRRITVQVSVGIADSAGDDGLGGVEVCFYVGVEVLGRRLWTADEVYKSQGVLMCTVPVSRAVASACIRGGRRVLLSATLDYVTRVTSGLRGGL